MKMAPLEKIEQRFPFPILILKGIGQIMLQENAYTGIFFLAGIFYGSTAMGLAALLSVCSGTITAQLFGYDKKEIATGIYGFSAALVGVALAFYFEPALQLWLGIIIGSALATTIQHWFYSKKIPVFTLPFVLITWLLMYFFRHEYPLAPAASLNAVLAVPHDFAFALRGFGQVIFQGSLFAGAVFFIGVFINSPIGAMYGLTAAVIAGVLACLFCEVPSDGVSMGLYSYNAVLCAIVFANDKVKGGILAFIAVALSVIISSVMDNYKLIPLTFPFVAATCIVLVLQNGVNKASVSIRNKTNEP